MRMNAPSARGRDKTLDEQLAELFEIEVPGRPSPYEASPVLHQAEATYASAPAEPLKQQSLKQQSLKQQSKISHFAERFIFILLAIGVFCSIGGFFLFVPLLPAFTVAVLLSGALAMFWIGIQLGSKRWRQEAN